MSSILEYFASGFINLLRNYPRTRVILSIVCLLNVPFYGFIRYYGPQDDISVQVFRAICLLLLGLSFFIILSFSDVKFKVDEFKEDLLNIKQEREKIVERIAQQNATVVDAIYLSLNQTKEYYTINLSQAKSSYRWSKLAIIIGFATLIFGSWLMFFGSRNVELALITGISALIIEFIGALNIYIYNKALVQLNLYFKELLSIQDTMLAIELCEKIDSTNPKKVEISERIIMNLLNRSCGHENLARPLETKNFNGHPVIAN